MKVLLVDDEVILLDSLESLIDWEEQGITLVGKVTNATEALKICTMCEPDLVVTDIKMRDMDGLELTATLGKLFPNIKVIIMSSFDEFSYMKRSIELKVSDYLLKLQTGKAEFSQAVLKVKMELEQNSGFTVTDSKQSEKIAESKNLLKGKVPVTDSGLAGLQLDCCAEDMQRIVAICFDDEHWLAVENFSRVNTVLQQMFPNTAVTYEDNIVYMMLIFADGDTGYQNVVARVKSQLSRQISPCSVAISSIESVKNVGVTFLQGKIAIEKRCFYGLNSSIYWDQLPSTAKITSIKPMPYEAFFADISNGNYPSILEKLNLLFDDSVRDMTYSLQQLFMLTEYIFLSLCNRESVAVSQDYINEKLDVLESTVLFDHLVQHINSILDYLKEVDQFGNTSPIVENCIEYISANFNQPISLNEIASYVNVTPAYLSKLFKKEKGVNITTYIQSIKIQHAKNMLVQESLNIVDIANQLGFDSSSYFTSIFQKHLGCSPTEYRKSLKPTT